MFGLRKIVGSKIKDKRGNRKRSAIVANGLHKFTEQDLYNWENELNLPRQDKLPYLLLGLGAQYEEISDPITVEIVAT